jgi:hypothetical protein
MQLSEDTLYGSEYACKQITANVLPLLAGFFVVPALGDVTLRIADDKDTESLVYVYAGRCRIETRGMTITPHISSGRHT